MLNENQSLAIIIGFIFLLGCWCGYLFNNLIKNVDR